MTEENDNVKKMLLREIEQAIQGEEAEYAARPREAGGIKPPMMQAIPEISIASRLPEMTNQVLETIARNPSGDFVIHNDIPCRIRNRQDGPVIEAHTRETVRGTVARYVNFVKLSRTATVPADPSNNLLDDLLTLPEYPENVPRVEHIARVPQLTEAGLLVSGVGLDAEHRLYYDIPDALRGLALPDNITESHINSAVTTLLEPFRDFPFAAAVDMANMLVLLISVLFRNLIKGVTPLFLVDGDTPGVGKGLLLQLIHLIASGVECDFSVGRINSDELRKRLFALAMEGVIFHVLDNVEGLLRQDSLASFLTSDRFRDRLLGESRTAAFSNKIVLTATGNQLRVGGDLARRSVLIQLKASVPRPHTRTDFAHPNVREYVKANRPEIVRAALLLVASWLRAGAPGPTKAPAMGSFEAFTHFTAGVLEHAGIEAVPFSNAVLIADRDEEAEEITLLLCRAMEHFADQPFMARQLAAKIVADELPMSIANANGPTLAQRLGRLLGRIEGRAFGHANYVVRQYDVQSHTKRYKVDIRNN